MASIKPQPVIVIDTREQTPWEFSNDIQIIRVPLDAGDYSIWGYESQIAIERKTLDDYVHTIIHDRDRWKRELEKLVGYECKCVIVEADLFDVRRKRYPSRTHPNSILGSSNAQFVDLGVPVFFASDRQTAEWMAAGILLRFWKNKTESMKVNSNEIHS
jgi:DNA excision repair protein ERCC-4